MEDLKNGAISEEALNEVAGGLNTDEALNKVANSLNIDRKKLENGLKVAGVAVVSTIAMGGSGIGIKKVWDKKHRSLGEVLPPEIPGNIGGKHSKQD